MQNDTSDGAGLRDEAGLNDVSRMRAVFTGAFICVASIALVRPGAAILLVVATTIGWIGAELVIAPRR